MTRRTTTLRLTSAAVSFALALMLLGVTGVAAKPPAWEMSVTAMPSVVSPGSPAAFMVTITNAGKSNISKLYLTDSRSETPLAVSPSTGCTPTGPLNCSLGALARGKSVTRIVVYQTPAIGASFDAMFRATGSGDTASDKKGTSHGDALTGYASTVLNSSPGFAGSYVIDKNAPISTGSGQKTTVYPPANGIGVTIQEGGSGSCANISNPIGELVTLNVGGGTHFAAAFKTALTIQASTLPDELQLSGVKFCHQYDNQAEGTLLPQCDSAEGPGNGPACFWPTWGGSYDPDGEVLDETDADDWELLFIDVWDYENGGLRGGY